MVLTIDEISNFYLLDYISLSVFDLNLSNRNLEPLINNDTFVRNSQKIIRLDIANCDVESEELELILAQTSMSNLIEFNIGDNFIDFDNLVSISKNNNLVQLKYLNIEGNLIKEKKAINYSDLFFENLVTFDVEYNELSSRDLAVILETFNFPNMRHLYCSRNSIDGKFIEFWKHFDKKGLTSLFMSYNNLTYQDIKKIIDNSIDDIKFFNFVGNEVNLREKIKLEEFSKEMDVVIYS